MTSHETDMPSDEAIRAALRRVNDPEAGMNIVDLGLVYGIEVEPAMVRIVMTMTTPACPMSAMIMDDVRKEVGTVTPGSAEVEVQLVWEPPWNAGMLSAHAKEHFGW
jgi:metal-sulfur cluster biosynthetic enzyme